MKILFSILVAALLAAVSPADAEKVNPTPSPDGKRVAYTVDNDIYVDDLASGETTRITFDGGELILNGYASWVYYEEIFGRPSKYRAFWWAPDSRHLAFYRFDNSEVPQFPIFSPFGQDGSLNLTRYPKAGRTSPSVRIGMADVDRSFAALRNLHGDMRLLGRVVQPVVWADFDRNADCWYGTPFWGADSRELYVSVMPRVQQQLDLFAVSAAHGTKRQVYHEQYGTWIDWMDDIHFTSDGLYVVRSFETGWEQIYFISYDGRQVRRLTDGENWGMRILRVDGKTSDIIFIAKRDDKTHPSLYKVDRKRVVTALTNPEYWADEPVISEDGRTFTARLSNASTPWFKVSGRTDKAFDDKKYGPVTTEDSASEYDLDDMPLPIPVKISNDGFDLYGLICYPKGFNVSERYPVVVELYGGPGTPYVRDRWKDRDASDRWCWENGIIWMVVDPRSSGENGRRGTDEAYRRMTVVELEDYVAWAEWLRSQPYVIPDRICCDGFSFGGTTTVMLLGRYPEYFQYGIAGGGVYDFRLYDSHYTERYMDTPEHNPEGYGTACCLNFVKGIRDGALRLTHGTGDDNVHFQNTLLLVDALQKQGTSFELMIYPDGMHGYRDGQKAHDDADRHSFWSRKLLGK